MLADSQYHRAEVLEQHALCPNCGTMVPVDSLQASTLGSLIRYARRAEQHEKKLVSAGRVASSVDVLFRDSTGWLSLPPLLQKVKRPLHELFAESKLHEKVIHLCPECCHTFADAEELKQRQLALKKVAHTRTPRPPAANGLGGLTFCERQSDRLTDFVFSPLQQVLRRNDLEIRAKQVARRRLVSENPQAVDWAAIPAAAAKEMQLVLHSAAAPELSSGEGVEGGTARQGSTVRMDQWVSSVSEPTGFSPHRRHLSDSTGEVEDDTIAHLEDAPESFHDASYADRLMFELWDHMCSLCPHGRPPADVAAEISRDDPLYVVYRSGRKRLPVPPHPNLTVDARFERRATFTDLIATEDDADTDTLRRMKDANALVAWMNDMGDEEKALLTSVLLDDSILDAEDPFAGFHHADEIGEVHSDYSTSDENLPEDDADGDD